MIKYIFIYPKIVRDVNNLLLINFKVTFNYFSIFFILFTDLDLRSNFRGRCSILRISAGTFLYFNLI